MISPGRTEGAVGRPWSAEERGTAGTLQLVGGDEPGAWSVLVELRGPELADLESDDVRVEELFNALFDTHWAAVTAGGNVLTVHMTIDGDSAVTDERSAALRGRNIVIRMLHQVGLE